MSCTTREIAEWALAGYKHNDTLVANAKSEYGDSFWAARSVYATFLVKITGERAYVRWQSFIDQMQGGGE